MDKFYDDWIPITRGKEILETPFYVKESREFDNYLKFSEFANWLVVASHAMPFNQRESIDDKLDVLNKFLKMLVCEYNLENNQESSMFRHIFRIVELMIFLSESGYSGTAKRLTQNAMLDLERLAREVKEKEEI